jgi:Beta-propeller repeat
LNAAGSGLIYSTYLGGNCRVPLLASIFLNDCGRDRGDGIALDSSGNVYVAGSTNSANFPLVNPLQPNYGGGAIDGFVSKLNAAGSGLVYSTYLGGGDYDYAKAIAADGSGNAYVTGSTSSTDFPTANPFQPNYGTFGDGFVSKISDGPSAGPTVASIRPSSGVRGTTVTVTLEGKNFLSGSTVVGVSGTGVTVGQASVWNSTTLTTVLAIAASATPGTRYVTVTTPSGTCRQGIAFDVMRNPLFPGDK